jgi:hypothetical protein
VRVGEFPIKGREGWMLLKMWNIRTEEMLQMRDPSKPSETQTGHAMERAGGTERTDGADGADAREAIRELRFVQRGLVEG